MSKLKLLCLHGFGENAVYFEKKTAALMRSVEDLVDLAPYPILPTEHASTDIMEEEGTTKESSSYGWWNPRRNDIMVARNKDVDPNERTWQLLTKVLTEQGPFDGIFGFSQGGGLASILSVLLLLQDQDHLPNPMSSDWIHPSLKCVILVGARMPIPSSGFTPLFMQPTKINIPSMHIIGELDTIVNPKDMDQLAACYKDPVIVRHPGGHFVPSITIVRKAFVSFLSSLIHKPSSPSPLLPNYSST